MVHSATGVVVT